MSDKEIEFYDYINKSFEKGKSVKLLTKIDSITYYNYGTFYNIEEVNECIKKYNINVKKLKYEVRQ